MNTLSQVPPGFRFHPTDEELVDYYLRRKVSSRQFHIDVIKDIDLYKIEPWDLQELCRIGTEKQNEWYFFSYKDRKYPTGTRTNRATAAGFWKATGRDKAIYSKHDLIGMRKTLVFYRGRAPNGQKSDWIMHEYRLETDENGSTQEEGWVVCRVFMKKIASIRKFGDHDSPIWYPDPLSFMDSPSQTNAVYYNCNNNSYTCCKRELNSLQYSGNSNGMQQPDHFLQLPFLESPIMVPPPSINFISVPCFTADQEMISANRSHPQVMDHNFISVPTTLNGELCSDHHVQKDWRVVDKLVASQLSHEHVSNKGNEVFDELNVIHGNMKNQQVSVDSA